MLCRSREHIWYWLKNETDVKKVGNSYTSPVSLQAAITKSMFKAPFSWYIFNKFWISSAPLCFNGLNPLDAMSILLRSGELVLGRLDGSWTNSSTFFKVLENNGIQWLHATCEFAPNNSKILSLSSFSNNHIPAGVSNSIWECNVPSYHQTFSKHFLSLLIKAWQQSNHKLLISVNIEQASISAASVIVPQRCFWGKIDAQNRNNFAYGDFF